MKRRALALGCAALLSCVAFSRTAAAGHTPPAALAEAREGIFAAKPSIQALAPGELAPAFALPGIDGKLVSSRSWLSQSGILVVSVGAPAKDDMSGAEPLPALGSPLSAEQVLAARRVAEAAKNAAPRLQKRGVAVVVIAQGSWFEAMKGAMGEGFKAAAVPEVIEPESPNLFLLRDDSPAGGPASWSGFAGLSESGVSVTGIDMAGFVRLNEAVPDLGTLEPMLTLAGDVSPKIEIGKPAPDFSVRDDKGRARRLSDLRGHKNLLLTFFPKCFTGGCANHLTSLQAERIAFSTLHTEVWAVSFDPADGERGQLAFARQLNLTMPLVPDVGKNLSMLYESALSPEQPALGRMTVLIDRDGIVRFVDRAVQVRTHGPDMLLKMRELGMK